MDSLESTPTTASLIKPLGSLPSRLCPQLKSKSASYLPYYTFTENGSTCIMHLTTAQAAVYVWERSEAPRRGAGLCRSGQ